MSSSKTLAAKVARRIVGFQGMAKAAQDNAARLAERVKEVESALALSSSANAALAKTVQEQAGQIEFLRGALAQFDQSAQGRMDSLAARVVALEEAARPAPAAEPGTVAEAEPETDDSIEPEYACPPNHDDE